MSNDDYILEISQLDGSDDPGDDESSAGRSVRQVRPWIGIHFECCGVYSRIYRNKEQTAYVGHCPKCNRQARIRVGPGGTSHRIFRAR